MTTDRKDLKIQALLESLSKDKTKHEDEIANLRVELTIASEELQEALARLQELESREETSDTSE